MCGAVRCSGRSFVTRASRSCICGGDSLRGRPASWLPSLSCSSSRGLSDRQAAAVARARIHWKFPPGLELTDPGFDHSLLSEFRDHVSSRTDPQRLRQRRAVGHQPHPPPCASLTGPTVHCTPGCLSRSASRSRDGTRSSNPRGRDMAGQGRTGLRPRQLRHRLGRTSGHLPARTPQRPLETRHRPDRISAEQRHLRPATLHALSGPQTTHPLENRSPQAGPGPARGTSRPRSDLSSPGGAGERSEPFNGWTSRSEDAIGAPCVKWESSVYPRHGSTWLSTMRSCLSPALPPARTRCGSHRASPPPSAGPGPP